MLVTTTTFNKEMDVGKELKENLSGKIIEDITFGGHVDSNRAQV